MRNKYYIPTIEEFHVGFEFEIFYQKGTYDMRDIISVADGGTGLPKFIPSEPNKEWHSDFIPLSGSDSHYWHYPLAKIQEVIDRKHIRVKYLDKEDCESLGWSVDQRGEYSIGVFYINWHTGDERPIWVEIMNDDEMVFDGVLQNKNELKKIMQQLKIEL